MLQPSRRLRTGQRFGSAYILFYPHPILAVPTVPLHEIDLTAVRAQGAGGQNVNKVSSAIHLRFDIRASSLPPAVKEKLLRMRDQRITQNGIVVIKAQSHRSRERNREEALQRLQELVASASDVVRMRRPTKPTRRAQLRRLDAKSQRGRIKSSRGKVQD